MNHFFEITSTILDNLPISGYLFMGILTKISEFILVLRYLFQNCSDNFPKFETLDNVLVDAFWQKNETPENEKAKN